MLPLFLVNCSCSILDVCLSVCPSVCHTFQSYVSQATHASVDRKGRSAAHFPLRQTWRFQLPYHKLSVPEQQHSIFASLWRFYLTAHTVCQGLLFLWMFYSKGGTTFIGEGYVRERLKSSLRKFYGQYGDLIKHYEVPLSQMLHDILGHDHLQWHP